MIVSIDRMLNIRDIEKYNVNHLEPMLCSSDALSEYSLKSIKYNY